MTQNRYKLKQIRQGIARMFAGQGLRTFIIAAIVANVGLGASALAYTQQQLHTEYTGTVLYDPFDTCSNATDTSATFGPGDLPSYIKAPYNSIFTAAAKKYNIDPAVLVGIFYDENYGITDAVSAFKQHLYRNPPPPYGSGPPWPPPNQFTAVGPFQFISGTWAIYANASNGHPPPDPNDLIDESFAAAHYLADLGATMPETEKKIFNAALGYNHDSHYAQNVVDIFKIIKQDEGGGASTGATTTTGSTACTGAQASSIDCYKNPLRDQHPLSPARIDEGVDYLASGPVYALGVGHVDYVNSGSGWPGGTFVSYILDCGPAAGKRVYVAENCKNIGVHVGQKVDSSTRLCTEINAYPFIETGWALAANDFGGQSVDLAAAYKTYVPDGTATAYGDNFDDLMVKLGAPHGTYQFSNQAGGKNLTGTLPTGWPQWK